MNTITHSLTQQPALIHITMPFADMNQFIHEDGYKKLEPKMAYIRGLKEDTTQHPCTDGMYPYYQAKPTPKTCRDDIDKLLNEFNEPTTKKILILILKQEPKQDIHRCNNTSKTTKPIYRLIYTLTQLPKQSYSLSDH